MVTIGSSTLSGNSSQGAGIFNDLDGTVTVKNQRLGRVLNVRVTDGPDPPGINVWKLAREK